MSNENRGNTVHGSGFLGGMYGLTIIGAVIYFIQHSTSFWGGVIGFFKGLIWPLLVTYKVLELLKF